MSEPHGCGTPNSNEGGHVDASKNPPHNQLIFRVSNERLEFPKPLDFGRWARKIISNFDLSFDMRSCRTFVARLNN